MAHLFTLERGVYAPDGKVNVSPDEAQTINADTNRIELEYWASKPDYFVPAYYEFPAEHLPLFGRPRVYRRSFTPLLYSYVNTDATSPDGLANKAVVKTWNGTILGRITEAHVYRHNFGGRMVSIRVKGTNGATYYGRASWDNGNVIRLRKVKA